MKIGKGAPSVLTVALRSAGLVVIGFLFGFLRGVSYNNRANVSHPPYSGRVVIQAPTGASNALFEDPTTLVKDAHFVESVPCNNHCPPCSVEPSRCSNTCPACSQFKDFPLVMATLQKSIDLERKRLKKKKPLKLLDATKNRILRMYRNATGSVCRAPSLVDRLPQSFIHRTTDFSFRYLVGHPDDDLQDVPKYLLALAVGIKQKASVNFIIKKFPMTHFQIVLFHYDSSVEEWNQFEWSKHVIHIQSTGQSKWWFSKRFLHPDVVEPYEYIFIWDEDLGVDNFDPLEYIDIIKRHELQISQPAVDGDKSWPITVRQYWTGKEVHKRTPWEGLIDNCTNSIVTPPCAGFVEIQAPVFAKKAWHCVWNLIQNDFVMAWGLDFQLQACIDGAPHEHIGIVDTEWVVHNKILSLGSEGADAEHAERKRGEVIARSFLEWSLNKKRWSNSIEAERGHHNLD